MLDEDYSPPSTTLYVLTFWFWFPSFFLRFVLFSFLHLVNSHFQNDAYIPPPISRFVLHHQKKVSSRHVHIGSDVQFLERRRRSLNRYIEFISNHPIINKDKVVIAFLTEINIEFSIWKKMNSTVFQIDSQKNDEASLIGKLSNSQENIINNTANNDNSFENIIKILKEELPLLIESINRFCSLIERIFFRNLQNENDFIRFKLAFDSFGEIYSDLSSNNNNSSSSSRQHQSDSNSTTTTVGKNSGRPKEIEEETILLQRELNKFSNGIGNIIELNERSNNERIEILENQFKLQRDLWRSLLFLINKYESKFKFDNVDKIKKRIESNQSRYSILNNNTNNENGSNINNNNSNNKRQQKEEEEKRKIINNIEIDQNEIERLMNRRIFYKWSLMCEIRLIWRYSTLMRVYISDLIIRENKVSNCGL